MKRISAILGRRAPCYWCRVPIQTAIIPTLGDKWQICETITEESDVITLHDCPMKPSKLAAAKAAAASSGSEV